MSASLGMRASRSASISAAVLPVAQTTKMCPKRASYRTLPSRSAESVSSLAAAAPDCSPADQVAVLANF